MRIVLEEKRNGVRQHTFFFFKCSYESLVLVVNRQSPRRLSVTVLGTKPILYSSYISYKRKRRYKKHPHVNVHRNLPLNLRSGIVRDFFRARTSRKGEDVSRLKKWIHWISSTKMFFAAFVLRDPATTLLRNGPKKAEIILGIVLRPFF